MHTEVVRGLSRGAGGEEKQKTSTKVYITTRRISNLEARGEESSGGKKLYKVYAK